MDRIRSSFDSGSCWSVNGENRLHQLVFDIFECFKQVQQLTINIYSFWWTSNSSVNFTTFNKHFSLNLFVPNSERRLSRKHMSVQFILSLSLFLFGLWFSLNFTTLHTAEFPSVLSENDWKILNCTETYWIRQITGGIFRRDAINWEPVAERPFNVV
jgi:hypothetical protein